MPIQNRVDMLATGVNTTIGIRVLGHDLDQVVHASEEIAAVVKRIPALSMSSPIRSGANPTSKSGLIASGPPGWV